MNEIREAFRLAAANMFDVNMAAFGGKIGLNVIGDVLSKYVAYRVPIAAEIKRNNDLKEQAREAEKQAADKEQFNEYVVDWFKTMKGKVKLEDCRFYFYNALEDLGYISNTVEQIVEYKRQATVAIRAEIKQKQLRSKNLSEMQELKHELSDLLQGNMKNRIINRAKELALFDAMK